MRVSDGRGRWRGGRRADGHRSERETSVGISGHNASDARRARPAGIKEQRGGHVSDSGQPVVAAAQADGTPEPVAESSAIPETDQNQVPAVRHHMICEI